MQIEEIDPHRVKEISEDILKSMLKRSYPAIDGTHYFKKYTNGKTPDHQFMHALAIMNKGGIIRIDKENKPFSVTFVLLQDGKPKMHHMIDDVYGSDTFGNMMNDPYEGDKKRQTCYRHLKDGYTKGCEKCELEVNSQICMMHGNVLSKCDECKNTSNLLKDITPKEQAPEMITAILKKYKAEYWSYDKGDSS